MFYFKGLASWNYNSLSSAHSTVSERCVDVSKKVNTSLQGTGQYIMENVKKLPYKAQEAYTCTQSSLKGSYCTIQSNTTHVSKQVHTSLKDAYQKIGKSCCYAKESMFGKKLQEYEQKVKQLESNVHETRKCFEAYLHLADLIANKNQISLGGDKSSTLNGQYTNLVTTFTRQHKQLSGLISECKIDISQEISSISRAKFEETQVEMLISILKNIFNSALSCAIPNVPLFVWFNFRFLATTVERCIYARREASKKTELIRNKLIYQLKDLVADLDDMQRNLLSVH
jgi:gas vesicle protein